MGGEFALDRWALPRKQFASRKPARPRARPHETHRLPDDALRLAVTAFSLTPGTAHSAQIEPVE
jgi:hypothetical protein